MKYEWAHNPHLYIPITLCVIVFLVFFVVLITALFKAFYRLGAFNHHGINQNLGIMERLIHQELLMKQFWSGDEFKRDREVVRKMIAGAFLSLLSALLIAIAFGHPS